MENRQRFLKIKKDIKIIENTKNKILNSLSLTLIK